MAVGASCLYHLAKAGCTDALLLEKNEMTSGSTWHAAGNVPTFSMPWAPMNMQRYSVELYQGLAEAVDYPMNYHVTGSLRLAHNRNRMMEFERACGMGRHQGMDLEMCAVSDLKARHPFLETHDLAGGMYDPADGDIDPSQLTQALAKGARDLGTAGINKVINGPIPYTPDGNPLISPMPGVPNAFEVCVFTFGIAQAGGAGKVLAEWVTDGQTEWGMWAVDPRRFTGFADQSYTNVKGREVYANEYVMYFPHHEWPAGRGKRLSRNHEKVTALGGVMGAYAGWERANWFAKAGDDTREESTHIWGRHSPWLARVAEECAAVAESAGVLDLPGFSRFERGGKGAAAWLKSQIAGALPKTGRMNLAYFADARGRILSEMSVMRFAEDDFLLITAATAEWHDYELLQSTIPEGLSLRNVTESSSALIVSGPKTRALFASISDANLSFPWLSHQHATIASRPALLARVSFAGELGWEVHAANADMPEIYAAVLAAGATPFGMYALDSLRLEKGNRTWKGDLSSDYTLLEAGLSRFVKLDKPENFPGKSALTTEALSKRFATLIVESGSEDAPYMSSIWLGDTVVGEVTPGGWGNRIGASIALCMLRPDLAVAGTALEVEIYGQRYAAEAQPDGQIYDPKNERLRA